MTPHIKLDMVIYIIATLLKNWFIELRAGVVNWVMRAC
jgi:hypothetical protein